VALVFVVCGGFEWGGGIHRLERALSSDDPAQRIDVVRRLAHEPGADARALLLRALDDPSAAVRAEAVGALGEARAVEAVPRLESWLGDGSAEVRASAARALGRIGDPAARPSLVRALGDGDAAVRQVAIEALARIGGPEVLVPIQGMLEDDEDPVRVAAAEALGELGDERAVVPLVGRARDEVPEVRDAVARALGRLGSPRAIPALLQALEDESEVVRLSAVSGLGRLGDPRAVDPLAEALASSNPRLREAALAALGAIGGERAVHVAAEALAEPSLRATAAEVLLATARREAREGGPGPTLDRLVEVLGATSDRGLATAVARVLAEAQAAGPAPALAAPLLDALRDGRGEPSAVVLALARTGAPEALLPLLQAADAAVSARDPDPDGALRTLAALEAYFTRAPADGRAADPLLGLLERARSPEVRASIARLLGRAGAARAVPELRALLSAEDDGLRLAAVTALGRIGEGATTDSSGGAAGATDALLPLLDDSIAEVRYRAALAYGAGADDGQLARLVERLTGRRRADRHALLIALGRALPRLGPELPQALAARVAEALDDRMRGLDPQAAARALDTARRWGSERALAAVLAALDHPSPTIRRQASRALGDFDVDRARHEARARLGRGGARLDVGLATALGEVGDATDADGLFAAAERGWPASGAASFALARLARRGALPVELAPRLCALAASREPYVRANALTALTALGAPACPDLDALALLSPGHDAAVRVAAARLLGADPGRAHAAALGRCAASEPAPELARACAEPALPPLGAPAEVYAYDATGTELARDRLMALRLGDGSVLVAFTDANGFLYLDRSPEGPLLLEDPVAASLEP
jgi:HEAT repeat protein